MKTKSHTRYRLESGKEVVGTTTVVNLLAKPALNFWYYKLGRDGIDSRKHLDFLAEIGTLAHSMIFHHLKGEDVVTSDYSQKQIDLASNSFESFLKWEKQHTLEPILLEEQLVSEEYKYGGTFDYYGLVDECPTILDFKSSGIYASQFIQLAAYKNLLKEHKYEVDNCWVLVIPTDKDKGFREAQKEDVSKHWETFSRLIPIYRLLKEIGR